MGTSTTKASVAFQMPASSNVVTSRSVLKPALQVTGRSDVHHIQKKFAIEHHMISFIGWAYKSLNVKMLTKKTRSITIDAAIM